MRLTTYLFTLLFSFLLISNAEARTCNCIVDGGDWGTISTWDCPGGPAAGDTVNIPVGITVNVDNVYTYTGDPMYINVDGTLHLGKPGSKLFLPCGSIVHFSITGKLTMGFGGGGSAREIHICDVLWWNQTDGLVFGVVTWGVITPLSSNEYQFHISNTKGKPSLNFQIEDKSVAYKVNIYRAVNSADFELIETLDSDTQINYTDHNIEEGTNYYKIALVSESGIQETVVLSFKKETSETSFYPNPVRDILTINIDNERAFKSVKIFSVTGELVHQTTNKVNTINVSDWESGVYLIQIEHENNLVTNRLVVQ